MATATPGSGTVNEVQTLTVRASAGTFTLTFGASTTGSLAYNISAGALKSALEGLSGIGAGNVDVQLSSSIAGALYTITFQGAKAHTDVTQLIAAGTLTARNETQQVSILGAASGNYKLFFDANNNGTVDGGEQTASILVGASAADVQRRAEHAHRVRRNAASVTSAAVPATVTTPGGTAYTIVLAGTARCGTIVRPLSIREAALQAQNEIQHVSLVYATGGKFTLTLDGHTTAPLDYNVSEAALQTAINGLSLPSGVTAAVTLTSGDYTITFSGGTGANQHIDKLVGDSGGLENSAITSTFTIAGFTATTNTTAAQLVSQLQAALDAAAVSGGITPGFLQATITSSLFTAGQAVYGTSGVAPNDTAFEIHITLANVSTGTFSVNATSGTFKLTFTNGPNSATTTALAVGSSGAVLKSAIEALSTFSGTATSR